MSDTSNTKIGDGNLLNRQAEVFAEVNPYMPLMTQMAFIFVAARGRCHQHDFEVEYNLINATASRSISFWCEWEKSGVRGMNYIDRREDPQDRRYRLLTLTPAGRAFYDRLLKGKAHG